MTFTETKTIKPSDVYGGIKPTYDSSEWQVIAFRYPEAGEYYINWRGHIRQATACGKAESDGPRAIVVRCDPDWYE